MEINVKKRVVGGGLLAAIGLLLIPLFFIHSIPLETLRLSMHMPATQTHPMHANVKKTAIAVPLSIAPTAAEKTPTSAFAAQTTSLAANPSVTPVSKFAAPTPATPAPATTIAPAPVKNTLAPATKTLAVAKPAPQYKTPTQTPATPIHNTKNTPPTPAKAKTPAPATATKAAAHKTTGWAIQLATFSDKISAQNLVKKLQGKHFPAYIHSTKTTKGELIQVFVGPKPQRNSADALLSRLSSELGMTGMVVKAH